MGNIVDLPTYCCDICDFTSTDPADFVDLGGDRMWGGGLMAFPTVCRKHDISTPRGRYGP